MKKYFLLLLMHVAVLTLGAQPDVVTARLERLPNIIEMPYSEVVQTCIDRYTVEPLKSRVGVMLGLMNSYMGCFEEALEANGMPLELRYLPVVLSRLDVGKKTGTAAGLWQIGVREAQVNGLEVNSLVDERLDPMRSSAMAVERLRKLYMTLGDWSLVLAAYKGGESTVQKAIARAGNRRDFWRIYAYLPAETRAIVPEFIAANYIMTYYCEYGIIPSDGALPGGTDTVHVKQRVALEQVEAVCDVPLATLKGLNPQYRAGLVPQGYALCLPEGKAVNFIRNEADVYAFQADKYLTQRTTVVVSKTQTTVKKRRTPVRRRRARARGRSRRRR
jgi:membrane-bound lytic murein transglycosylase D